MHPRLEWIRVGKVLVLDSELSFEPLGKRLNPEPLRRFVTSDEDADAELARQGHCWFTRVSSNQHLATLLGGFGQGWCPGPAHDGDSLDRCLGRVEFNDWLTGHLLQSAFQVRKSYRCIGRPDISRCRGTIRLQRLSEYQTECLGQTGIVSDFGM